MIRSMTGFAATSGQDAHVVVHVTIKSVNHRFLDVVIKAPHAVAVVEGPIKAVVQQRLGRGRIEVSVSAELTAVPSREVVLDEALLERIVAVLHGAEGRGLIRGGLTASDVLRIPQVLDVRSTSTTASHLGEAAQATILAVATEALEALVTMRETEGRFLATDLDARLEALLAVVAEVERLTRQGQRDLETRLRARIAELPPDLAGDPAAVAQEIVRVVARSDIDEELVRLRGHVAHWRELAAGPEPCGRKLDFLVQEMNREINTMGAKAEGASVTTHVIEAKAQLERVREQVQNVE